MTLRRLLAPLLMVLAVSACNSNGQFSAAPLYHAGDRVIIKAGNTPGVIAGRHKFGTFHYTVLVSTPKGIQRVEHVPEPVLEAGP